MTAETAAGPRPEPTIMAGPSLPGAWGALIFVSLSFSPSLLPRSGLFQGVVAGVDGAIGYGLGVLAAWLWREFADRGPRPAQRHSWLVLAGVAVIVLIGSAVLGRRWQDQLRDLMGIPDDDRLGPLLMPVVGAVVLILLIGAGRALRSAARALSGLLGRVMGARAARALGWVVVTALVVTLLNGVLYRWSLVLADRSFAVQDTITPEGVQRPASGLRSGSPASLISWDSLGREGRKFTASGPTVQEVSTFTGSAASEPIRVFAGSASAPDAISRADLAVRDLERAGGFSRAYLLVVTTTGSGWVEPSAVDSFEYITEGDSAIVAMQYSHLPSWLSYLVDQRRARDAGRELFDAVYHRWSQLPAADRPELLVFGESLGSFGAEAAFSGDSDLANRTSGALFVGAPSFNTLAGEFTQQRDRGSTQIEPVYRQGRIVRFTSDVAEDIPPAASAWERSRVLYLQHPSDPIVWWNTSLLLTEPDWLEEAPGRDVLGSMVWIPFVTFWQVTADLPQSVTVPAGHGHVYRGDHVDGWVAVLQPAGWSTGRSQELRAIIAALEPL